MKSFILTALVAVAFVASSTTFVHAQPQNKKLTVNKSLTINKSLSINNSLSLAQRTKFVGGNYFNGCYRLQNYCGWTSRCYYPQYGCYCYYCPQQCLWFYWCDSLCCYAPITYIQLYRPTTIGIVLQQGAFAPTTLPGVALPPGATGLSQGGVGGIQQGILPKN